MTSFKGKYKIYKKCNDNHTCESRSMSMVPVETFRTIDLSLHLNKNKSSHIVLCRVQFVINYR